MARFDNRHYVVLAHVPVWITAVDIANWENNGARGRDCLSVAAGDGKKVAFRQILA